MKTFRALVEWNAWDFASAYEDLQRDEYRVVSITEVEEREGADDGKAR